MCTHTHMHTHATLILVFSKENGRPRERHTPGLKQRKGEENEGVSRPVREAELPEIKSVKLSVAYKCVWSPCGYITNLLATMSSRVVVVHWRVGSV